MFCRLRFARGVGKLEGRSQKPRYSSDLRREVDREVVAGHDGDLRVVAQRCPPGDFGAIQVLGRRCCPQVEELAVVRLGAIGPQGFTVAPDERQDAPQPFAVGAGRRAARGPSGIQ